ncbi:hypothetical protein UFOVP238_4 [uncultured Caudovirales phage]|uniref:Phage head morphogenesis domain-containing protein n=1 Tax=uncultured Caudovirales phage TaxID=2100421 RepID=A0A6J7WTU9_9CAUD|nr:hypothetical protein UFOVP238_4 [uncultured Caudovirales phage]
MTENYPQGPGFPVPSQSKESRRNALRGEFMPATKKNKKRWYNIQRKDRKGVAITPNRIVLVDAESRIDQLADDFAKHWSDTETRDTHGRWSVGGQHTVVFPDGVNAMRSKPALELARYHNVHKDWERFAAVDPAKRKRIADFYDAAEDVPADKASPEVKKAYAALTKEVGEQYKVLTQDLGVKVEFTDEDPYENYNEMQKDYLQNKRIKIMRTASTGSHPLMTDEQNDQFRAVHDAFGHLGTGCGFDRHGEEAAYQAHKSMFSPEAQKAAATELRGQNSFLIDRGFFGPQKLVIMPEELRKRLAALLRKSESSFTAQQHSDRDNAYSSTGSHHVSLGRVSAERRELSKGDKQGHPFHEQVTKAEFDEKKHRRDNRGRFSRKGSSKGSGTSSESSKRTFSRPITPASETDYKTSKAKHAIDVLNASYVAKENKKSIPVHKIAQYSFDARGDLKERSVYAVSKLMAKDPDFVAWHKGIMKDTPEAYDFRTFMRDNNTRGDGYVTPSKAARILAQVYIDQWAESSGGVSPLSWAIQKTASDTFDVPYSGPDESLVTKKKINKAYVDHRVPITSFLNACYEQTQVELKKAGVTEVPMYRGYNTPVSSIDDKEGASIIENCKHDKQAEVDVDCNPLTSWSTSEDIAEQFAGFVQSKVTSSDASSMSRKNAITNVPMVLYANVPAERILSIPCSGMGCYNESEAVVVGGSGMKIGAKLANNILASSYFPAVKSVLTGKEYKSEKATRTGWYETFTKTSAWKIDTYPDSDWPKRTPDRMSDIMSLLQKGEKEGHPFRGNQWTKVRVPAFKTWTEVRSWFSERGVFLVTSKLKSYDIGPKEMQQVAKHLTFADKKFGGAVFRELRRITIDTDPKVVASVTSLTDPESKGGSTLGIGRVLANRLIDPEAAYEAETKAALEQGWSEAWRKRWVGNVSMDAHSTIMHEVGHLIQNDMDRSDSPTWKTKGSIYVQAADAAGWIERDRGKQREAGLRIGHDVSSYASSSPHELHSEIVALINSPDMYATLDDEAKKRVQIYQDTLNELASRVMVKVGGGGDHHCTFGYTPEFIESANRFFLDIISRKIQYTEIEKEFAVSALKRLNKKQLDKLINEEIKRQAPALSRAVRRTMETLISNPEMQKLIRSWMQGDFSGWQIKLESAASTLHVNPKVLADALEVPYTVGYAMPTQAMPKAVDFQMSFEQPDILASKWAYSHSGEMITTQSRHMVNTISQMVSEAANGDMTVQDLKWELSHMIKLPPRYANAVRNYRKSLKASGKKASISNRLADQYARRLLVDHADVIARTEVMNAMSEGQQQFWNQMVESNVLPAGIVRRQWSTSHKENVCGICRPMDGVEVDFYGQFTLPNGVVVERTPAHPRCVCSIILSIPEPKDLLRAKKK